MGGSSKKQTVGFRYSLGAHLAICHGPVDSVREIRVDDRVAWSFRAGEQTGGSGAQPVQEFGTFVMSGSWDPQDAGSSLQAVGILSGVSIGDGLLLSLLDDQETIAVRVLSIVTNPKGDVTQIFVKPDGLAFAAQMVTVSDEAPPEDADPGGGAAAGGRIRIDKPELFGGRRREGGVVGDVDVMMGGPDQGQNDYLAARMGGPVPGYRGILSLVLRQVYVGNNPYLKPWAVRATRVMKAQDGNAQWYAATAAITCSAVVEDTALYIALDVSGSMSGSRMAAQKAAVAQFIAEIGEGAGAVLPNDIRIVLWNASVEDAIERRDMDAQDYLDLEAWMLDLPNSTSGGTNFDAAFSQAASFFAGAGDKRRVIVFVTDGDPTPVSSVDDAEATIAGLGAVDIYGVNIALADTSFTERVDNTPAVPVPVVAAGDPGALAAALRQAFGNPDMNPAHILRECLTNRDWGLGYFDADIGASFTSAADTLLAEGFGLSLLWQQDSSIEDFMRDVLDHIDAHLFVDRRTGLWEMRLIRDDYDPDAVPVFDESSVIDWGQLARREPGDLINAVTLRYTDARTDETSAITLTDTALVQQSGQVLATTIEMPGIRCERLASRVASRELRALSRPLLSGTITVGRAGAALQPGDVIRLDSTPRAFDGVFMRVSEISFGDGRDNGVRLTLTEDVFSLGGAGIAGGVAARPRPITSAPRPLARRMVIEAPYWQLVQDRGHTGTDAALAEDPDLGAILAAGERPSADALAVALWRDEGAGPEDSDTTDFVPSAILDAAVSDDPEAGTLAVADWTGIERAATGDLALLGDEFVRIDGIDAAQVTVGRGCLDTVPQAHPAGTPLLIFGGRIAASDDTFATGQSIGVRLLPETAQGTIALAGAPEDTAVMDGRAIRPLPVGNFTIDGAFAPADVNALGSGSVLLEWAHRDRLAQTSAVLDDYTAGDIGPEPGVSYTVEIRWVDAATGDAVDPPAAEIAVGTDTSYTLEPGDVPLESSAPANTAQIDVAVRASREVDGTLRQDRGARAYRLTAPFALGWDMAWGINWGNPS